MDKYSAMRLAKKYSRDYGTFWYVRDVGNGNFEPWAHSSDDAATVACYYSGERWE